MENSQHFVALRHREANTHGVGATQPAYDDLIDLSIGDPDVTTSDLIIDGAAADAKAGHTHYTNTLGDPELRAEFLRYWADEYGYQPELDQVMVTTSACHGMYLALQATINPGDEVLIPEPAFFIYPEQVRAAGGVPVFVGLVEEEDFQLRVERLEAARTERTRALIVNTPNNPTGTVQRRGTLEELAAWAKEHDILVLADEIYTIFSYAEPYAPIATLPGMAERTVTVQSFSKDYVMTGWRIGSVVAPAAVVATMRRLNDAIVFSAPSVSQRAAIHALRHRHEIQPELRQLYRERLLAAVEGVNKVPGMHAVEPEGTFYLWVNIKGTGLSSADVAQVLLDEAHVRVIPGHLFGPSGEGYLRLAATCSTEKLRTAFERMATLELNIGR